jgi:hypothetical protein
MSNVRGHLATLLKSAMLLALLLPLAFVGAAAWAWWPTLGNRWAFLASGLFLLYSVAAYLITRQFGQIGIAGQPSAGDGGRDVALRALQQHAALTLLLFLAVAVGALWLLRQIFSS